jgi:type IV pilus assembly protein PilW
MFLDGAPKSRVDSGFTLIELMVSIAIGLVVLASVATTFTSQTRAYSAQEQINQMEQNLRGALDIMTREIKMAGYRPNGGTVTGVVSYTSTSLTIQADIDGNGTLLASGSGSDTANEQIVYVYDSVNKKITRQVGSGTAATLAENISAFTFTYYQSSGATLATSASNIRRIKIALTGITAKPDPGYSSNGGYRTVDLSAIVTPINLGL